MAVDRMQLALQAMTTGGPEVAALQKQVEELLKTFGKLKDKSDEMGKTTGFEKFADGVEQFIKAPLETAGTAASSFLKSIGPVGAGLTAAGAAIGVFGKLSFDAAKQLGEYGDRLGDTGVRLNMTAKEVAQFTFAMKRGGGDIGTVESAIRTLSKGLSDFGDEGKEVRQTLRDLGVTTRDPKQAITELSGVFAHMENAANRNTLAIKLFGRAGLELLPDLMELSEGLARAKELGWDRVRTISSGGTNTINRSSKSKRSGKA